MFLITVNIHNSLMWRSRTVVDTQISLIVHRIKYIMSPTVTRNCIFVSRVRPKLRTRNNRFKLTVRICFCVKLKKNSKQVITTPPPHPRQIKIRKTKSIFISTKINDKHIACVTQSSMQLSLLYYVRIVSYIILYIYYRAVYGLISIIQVSLMLFNKENSQ